MKRVINKIFITLLYAHNWLLGKMPDRYLYGLYLWSIYILLYRVLRYRKKVVRDNLEKCFPEKSEHERLDIERRFFLHLTETIVDTVTCAGTSRKRLQRRMDFIGLDEHLRETKGKNWIAALAHYGSWEYFGVYQLNTPDQVVGVYHPITNKAIDDYFFKVRSRFGLRPVTMAGTLLYMVRHRNDERKTNLGLIADQNPTVFAIDKWFDFLGRKTAFYMGTEKIALRLSLPVYFMHTKKIRRACYQAHFEMIYDGSERVQEGEITRRYVEMLERQIRMVPELWMWSHRRWKHKPPEE